MNEECSQILWGVLLNFLHIVLLTSSLAIFHSFPDVSTHAAFVVIFVGQLASTLPTLGVAKRNWSMTSPSSCVVFTIIGFLLTSQLLLMRGTAGLMNIGDFAAIEASTILFAPLISSLMRRRCVGVIDSCGVLLALVGIILVAHPSIIFSVFESTPSYAYLLAFLAGLQTLAVPFFFGAFPDVHWSNFLLFRLACSAAVAAACLVVGGVTQPSPTDWTLASTIGFFVVGVSTTVDCVAQLVGCQELESFDSGMAGFMGNMVKAAKIPLASIMEVLYFADVITSMEVVGIAVVFAAITLVTVVKCYAPRMEK